MRHAGGATRHVHAHHPFDVIGWDGTLFPYALSIRDFEPVVGRIHQPPPVHQTFEAPGFVVCSFVPRPYDFHPDALKVPYHHANVDSDEVLFYSDGDFMSRAGSGIECRIRGRDGAIEDRVDGRRAIPEQGAEPECQSIDKDRLGGLGPGDGGCQVRADIDRRPGGGTW